MYRAWYFRMNVKSNSACTPLDRKRKGRTDFHFKCYAFFEASASAKLRRRKNLTKLMFIMNTTIVLENMYHTNTIVILKRNKQ